jgi:hypothetical protein
MKLPMPVDLRNLFLHLQGQLAAWLQSNRAILDHGPAKGQATEEGWREMLGEYLPNRYCVSKAFVIDADGSKSQEIDLVIYDRQYSPFLFKQGQAVYIPAESVYAVFEVKQELSASTVRDASEKAASVRSLRRTSVSIPYADGEYPARSLFPILAGLLALESSWNPPLGDRLVAGLESSSPEGRLDLLCALRHGSAEVTYGDMRQATLDISAPDAALIFFFLRLLERLRALATVPAIDLRAYGRSLTV